VGSPNILAVVLWMTGALFAFSAIAVSVRELTGILGVFDILALRYAASAIILLGLAALKPDLRSALIPRNPKLHIVRNLFHFAGSYAWALGVMLLPLATVFALEFTTPAWVALLAVLVLRERMTLSRAAAILLGLAGVIVILRPGLETVQPAALIVLGAAVAFGATNIATKALTKDQSTFTIVFWMNLMQLPLAFAGSDPASLDRLDASSALPLLGILFGGLASHWCLTNAYRHGDAIMVVPLDFLRIPLIALIGWWLYQERLDPFLALGAGLIIAGIVWNLRGETKKGPQLDPVE